MDQYQVEKALQDNGRLLNTLVTDYEQTATDLAEAETDYKRGVALATVKLAETKMTVDQRKAQVELETIDLFSTYNLAKVAHSVVKEKISCTKARLDVLRTLSAANRVPV